VNGRDVARATVCAKTGDTVRSAYDATSMLANKDFFIYVPVI